MKRLLFVTVLVLISVVVSVRSAPTIDAPWGRISGVDVSSPSGIPYSAYLGIPFALPPVGPLRFSKPVPHPGPGAGATFNGSSMGFICPQLELEVLPTFPDQSEDCLSLNVYTPATASDRPRSVMVWIYGGGYFAGSAAGYTPSKLVVDGDVIVVVLQYRLAIFGFLSTDDDVAAGNYGLHDQALAMKWVKDNIRAFGGDPDTITLFGESAGAGSIGFHLLSPYTKDLFLRGVQQSGTPLAYWAINKKPTEALYTLAKRTGCLDASASERLSWTVGLSSMRRREHERIVSCLRALDMEKIRKYSVLLDDNGRLNYFKSTPWTPVVDGDFVPRPPQDLLNDADYLLANNALKKDVMIGVNNNEGGYVLDIVVPASAREASGGEAADGSTGLNTDGDEDKANDVFTAFAAFDALDEKVENLALKTEILYRYPELERDERRLNTIVNVLNFFYLKPLKDDVFDVQAIADTFADIFFTTGAVEMSKSLAKAYLKYPQHVTGSLYLYLFNHFPASKAGMPLQGVNHGEDMLYQFDSTLLLPQDLFNAEDRQVEQNFIAMLADFAKTGNANSALGTQLGGNWPQYTLSEESYLSLSASPSVERQLYGKRIALWLDLLPSLVNSTRPVVSGHTSLLTDYLGFTDWNHPPKRNIWHFQEQGLTDTHCPKLGRH